MELRAAEGETRGLRSKETAREGATMGVVAAVPARGVCVGVGKGGASSFARRCVGLVKEKRARLYIARRCVTMLA